MRYIAYYRVSTKTQGDSGLGLEAQKRAVLQFIKDDQLIGDFTEVESGKRTDRPVLHEAISRCKQDGAVLLIAKLDRLSRNASFTLSLLDSRVKFVAVDMPQATDLTIGIMALLAQDEAERISKRTKSALSSIKERLDTDGVHVSKAGRKIVKLGTPRNLTDEARKRSAEVRKQRVLNNENNKRAFAYIEMCRKSEEGPYTYAQYAKMLNDSGFKTSTGGNFIAMSVKRLIDLYDKDR